MKDKSAQQINATWFKDQMKRRGLSYREIAKRLNLTNHSVVSHILTGRRKIAVDELTDWALLLGVSIQDIMEHGGWNPLISDNLPERHGSINITEIADENFKVSEFKGYTEVKVPNPMPGHIDASDSNVTALRCQTAGTALEVFDGAVMIYYKQHRIDPEALGRLCVLKLLNGEKVIRVLKRGYEPGKYNLAAMDGKQSEMGVSVVEASPIIWMKL